MEPNCSKSQFDHATKTYETRCLSNPPFESWRRKLSWRGKVTKSVYAEIPKESTSHQSKDETRIEIESGPTAKLFIRFNVYSVCVFFMGNIFETPWLSNLIWFTFVMGDIGWVIGCLISCFNLLAMIKQCEFYGFSKRIIRGGLWTHIEYTLSFTVALCIISQSFLLSLFDSLTLLKYVFFLLPCISPYDALYFFNLYTDTMMYPLHRPSFFQSHLADCLLLLLSTFMYLAFNLSFAFTAQQMVALQPLRFWLRLYVM